MSAVLPSPADAVPTLHADPQPGWHSVEVSFAGCTGDGGFDPTWLVYLGLGFCVVAALFLLLVWLRG